MDYSKLSSAQLREMAGIESKKNASNSFSSMSTEELRKIAGVNHQAEAAKAAELAMGQADAFKDLFSGVGQGLVNATAAPLNLVNALESKAFGMKPAPLKVNFRGDNSGIAGNIGEFVGGAIAPNPASKINLLSKVNPASFLSNPVISKIINAIPQGAVMGAGAAATNSGDLGSGAGMGAGMNALLSGLPPALKAAVTKGGEKVITKGAERYKNAVANNIDKYPALHNNRKQISEIVKQIPGVPVNLSELANHEAGKSFYTDFLGHAPFTGVRDNEKKLLNKAYQKKDELLQSLKKGKSHDDMTDSIISHLSDTYAKRKAKTSENFSNVFKMAKKDGISFSNSENFTKEAKRILSEQKNGLAKEIPIEDINYIKNLKKTLGPNIPEEEPAQTLSQGVFKKRDGVMIPGDVPSASKEKKVSLEEAHFRRSDIGDEAREAKSPTLRGYYSSLKSALTKDMEDAILGSKNKKISKMYQEALKFHAEKYLPYKHDEIQNLINNKADRATLANKLLKTQHNKILNEMPQGKKNMLAYLKIGKKEGADGKLDISPAYLANKVLTLSPEHRSKLFSKDQLKNFHVLNALSSASQKAQTAMKKPPTGYRNMHEGILAGLASLGKGGAGLIAGGNISARVMESPEVRNALIKNRAIKPSALMKDVMPKFKQSDKVKKITEAASRPNYLNSLLMMLQQ